MNLIKLLLVVALVGLVAGQSADVGVSKAGPNEMIIGFNQDYQYQVNIANAGPDQALNVQMWDPLPTQLVFRSVSISYSNNQAIFSCIPDVTSVPGQTIIRCNITSMNPGDTARVLINVTVPANLAVPPGQTGFNLSNTAYANATTPDPDPQNNQITRTIPVVLSADMAINILGPSNAIAGQKDLINNTIVVQNLGYSDAQSVVATYNVSSTLIVRAVASASGNCSFSGQLVTCNFGTVPTNATRTFLVQMEVPADALLPAGGNVTNLAVVTSPTPDPNLLNNNATYIIGITVQSDVSVTKGSLAQVNAGDAAQVVYTIVVDNAGPSTADGVIMYDPLPAPFVLVSASAVCNTSPTPNKRFTKDAMLTARFLAR